MNINKFSSNCKGYNQNRDKTQLLHIDSLLKLSKEIKEKIVDNSQSISPSEAKNHLDFLLSENISIENKLIDLYSLQKFNSKKIIRYMLSELNPDQIKKLLFLFLDTSLLSYAVLSVIEYQSISLWIYELLKINKNLKYHDDVLQKMLATYQEQFTLFVNNNDTLYKTHSRISTLCEYQYRCEESVSKE